MRFDNSNRTSSSILCTQHICKLSHFEVTYFWRRNFWEFWCFNWSQGSHVSSNHGKTVQNISGIKYYCFHQFLKHMFKRNKVIAPRIPKICVPTESVGPSAWKNPAWKCGQKKYRFIVWTFSPLFVWFKINLTWYTSAAVDSLCLTVSLPSLFFHENQLKVWRVAYVWMQYFFCFLQLVTFYGDLWLFVDPAGSRRFCTQGSSDPSHIDLTSDPVLENIFLVWCKKWQHSGHDETKSHKTCLFLIL